MKQENEYFDKSQRKLLQRVFTDTADYIHEKGIEQIAGAGSSAYPFALAVRRAYRQRYGRIIPVVNLGDVAEFLRYFNLKQPTAHANAGQWLRNLRPKFDWKKKSLLLDEFGGSGRKLGPASRAFTAFGIPHKTAVLFQIQNPETLENLMLISKEDFYTPDFSGRTLPASHTIFDKVWIKRGATHLLSRTIATPKERKERTSQYREWAAHMRQIHRELREIVKGVEKAKRK